MVNDSSKPCHSDDMFMVTKFANKDGQAPSPNYDCRSGALSVGPDMVNDSSFRALSQSWRV